MKLDQTRMLAALALIATEGCTSFTGDSTCRDASSGKYPGAYYLADKWCEGCVASWGLGIRAPKEPGGDA